MCRDHSAFIGLKLVDEHPSRLVRSSGLTSDDLLTAGRCQQLVTTCLPDFLLLLENQMAQARELNTWTAAGVRFFNGVDRGFLRDFLEVTFVY